MNSYSWNFSCEQKWVFTRTNLLFLPIFMSRCWSFSDQQVSVSQVIGRLVHHIGSMSLHQLHELHQTPLAGFVLHSQSLDPDYLQRVCDILDKAVSNRHEETILCTLIILQVSYHDDHTLYPHHLTGQLPWRLYSVPSLSYRLVTKTIILCTLIILQVSNHDNHSLCTHHLTGKLPWRSYSVPS